MAGGFVHNEVKEELTQQGNQDEQKVGLVHNKGEEELTQQGKQDEQQVEVDSQKLHSVAEAAIKKYLEEQENGNNDTSVESELQKDRQREQKEEFDRQLELAELRRKEEIQDSLQVMVDVAVKKYVDTTVQKFLKEELQNTHQAVAKTAELKFMEHEERRTQDAADASIELKRYVEWELHNAVAELRGEMKKLVEEETKKTIKAAAELSCEVKKAVEGEAENTIKVVEDEAQKICERFTDASEELKKCIEDTRVVNKASTDEVREFVVVFEQQKRISPSRGNLLTTIETLGKEYHVHFCFTPSSASTGCRNIFHMTINGNNELYGDCIPSVSFLSAKQCFSITSAVNGELNHKQNTTTALPPDNTYVLDIIQEHNEGKYYTYKIFLNHILMYAILNYDARDFNMVKVYVSNPWTYEQAGYMENLIIKTKPSDYA